jgi:hypothetical protein
MAASDRASSKETITFACAALFESLSRALSCAAFSPCVLPVSSVQSPLDTLIAWWEEKFIPEIKTPC